ncbi:MAG: regulatory iron-sulfur-containing complex subunit RicT [Phycisphaerae bacterium]
MVSLPQHGKGDTGQEKKSGCGSCGSDAGGHCGAGLEKVYPTTAVRFGVMNNIGEFTYRPGTVFKCGAKVVIQTERGIELGEQVSLFCNGCSKQVTREQIKTYVKNSGPEFYNLKCGKIIREATPDDINEHEHLNSRLKDDIDHCALIAMQMGLDMKIVTAEHLLGGERIVFYYRAEQRIDFRELVRNLATHYHTRIEMRQVGARDEARLVADYEICGRECCCKNFLKKLRPVGMKMAKVQKATLDPSKVSGRCGRLRCCLRYEQEGYDALLKKLPKINARVGTEFGNARVIDRQILTQLVLVETADQRRITIPVEELIEPCDGLELAAPPATSKPDAPPRRSERSRPPSSRETKLSDSPQSDSTASPSRPPQDRRPSSRRGGGRRPDMENTNPETPDRGDAGAGERTNDAQRPTRRRRRRRGDSDRRGGATPPADNS